jgi:uncharacterized protein HemX
MNLTPQQAREMAKLIGLDIPEVDLQGVALRLSALLTAMEAIESELGAVMDKTEPIPPVYPHEPEG